MALEPIGNGRYRLSAAQGTSSFTLALLIAPDCEIDNGAGACAHWPASLPGAPGTAAHHELILRKTLMPETQELFTWLIPAFPMPGHEEHVLLGASASLLEAEASRCLGQPMRQIPA